MVNSLVYRRDKKFKKKKERWICHNRRDRKASDRIKVGGYAAGVEGGSLTSYAKIPTQRMERYFASLLLVYRSPGK